MDFKRLAWINRIKPPYVIKIGQYLRFKSKSYKSHVKKGQVKKGQVKKGQVKKKTIATKIKNNKSVAATKNLTKQNYKTNLKWSWPVRGKVIQYFSPTKGKKGIDIAVPNRAPVKSTESGKIVYSGHGLTGYGHLIIIKHNNKYLSAYAHNSKRLVEEGAVVKRNQLIAYAGKTSAERVKLHFEIRKNGKPVNPLDYLPK